VWVEVIGHSGGDVAVVLDELSARAVRDPPNALGEPEPGVVVAGDTGNALLDALARHQEAGRMVLVVAPSPEVYREMDVWGVLAAGAADMVAWEGPSCADVVEARLERWREIEQATAGVRVRRLVRGRSPVWVAAVRRLVEVAQFTASPVLLTGESGTGKELAANLIHALDRRDPKGAFVVLDCTTLVPTLSFSEIFGHERGAFTGAVEARDGAVGLAHGGTLFLDEVGELPLSIQAELLRVIQEGTYKRVGSSRWHNSTFRLVCATNRDLEAEVGAGRFRRDLLFRISGAVVRLPPLRERLDDVMLLFRSFLAELLPGDGLPEVTTEVGRYICSRRYDGNVRELRQLAARVAIRHVGPGPITPGDLPEEDRPESGAPPGWDRANLAAAVRGALEVGLTLGEIEKVAGDLAVEAALADASNRVAAAAERLGVSDRAIHYRLKAKEAPPRARVIATGETAPSASAGDARSSPRA
jgi:transcriptional regulator with GAF, ATPase, and Fis domain